MGKIVCGLMLIFLFSSCGVSKKISKGKTYKWEDKMVTKKEYDSLLYNHTYKFVMEYKENNN